MGSREFSRARRVADQLRRELAEMLVREVNDPRFAAVTLSDVQVSRDLSHARVQVTVQPGFEVEDTVRALNRAAGFLRRGLAQRVHIKHMPELRFVHDPTLERASRLHELIDSALEQDAQRRRRKSRGKP